MSDFDPEIYSEDESVDGEIKNGWAGRIVASKRFEHENRVKSPEMLLMPQSPLAVRYFMEDIEEEDDNKERIDSRISGSSLATDIEISENGSIYATAPSTSYSTPQASRNGSAMSEEKPSKMTTRAAAAASSRRSSRAPSVATDVDGIATRTRSASRGRSRASSIASNRSIPKTRSRRSSRAGSVESNASRNSARSCASTPGHYHDIDPPREKPVSPTFTDLKKADLARSREVSPTSSVASNSSGFSYGRRSSRAASPARSTREVSVTSVRSNQGRRIKPSIFNETTLNSTANGPKRERRRKSADAGQVVIRKRGRPCKDPLKGPLAKMSKEERLAYNARYRDIMRKKRAEERRKAASLSPLKSSTTATTTNNNRRKLRSANRLSSKTESRASSAAPESKRRRRASSTALMTRRTTKVESRASSATPESKRQRRASSAAAMTRTASRVPSRASSAAPESKRSRRISTTVSMTSRASRHASRASSVAREEKQFSKLPRSAFSEALLSSALRALSKDREAKARRASATEPQQAKISSRKTRSSIGASQTGSTAQKRMTKRRPSKSDQSTASTSSSSTRTTRSSSQMPNGRDDEKKKDRRSSVVAAAKLKTLTSSSDPSTSSLDSSPSKTNTRVPNGIVVFKSLADNNEKRKRRSSSVVAAAKIKDMASISDLPTSSLDSSPSKTDNRVRNGSVVNLTDNNDKKRKRRASSVAAAAKLKDSTSSNGKKPGSNPSSSTTPPDARGRRRRSSVVNASAAPSTPSAADELNTAGGSSASTSKSTINDGASTSRGPSKCAGRAKWSRAKPTTSGVGSSKSTRRDSRGSSKTPSSSSKTQKSSRKKNDADDSVDESVIQELMREEDIQWLKDLDLHYPGKQYRLAKKGTVDEHGGRDYVKEIDERSHETLCYWILRDQEYQRKGKEFDEDFIVGCSKYEGEWDDIARDMEVEILMKYREFPRGYWLTYKSAEERWKYADNKTIQQWRWREAVLSKVRTQMRKECAAEGKDFDQLYPQVFVPKVQRDITAYALDRVAIRRTQLRAREATINEILQRVGLPPIVIEEWTGDAPDDDNLMDFIYTNYIHPSKKVKHALNTCVPTLEHKCASDCSCNGDSSKSRKICNCQRSKCTHTMEIAAVECFDECGCTVDSCASRVLQRGRQLPILIIRHPIKGWTMRALDRIEKGTFIGEYAGEMLTAWENDQRAQTYSIDLPDVMIDTRKESNFTARKSRKGSERWQDKKRPEVEVIDGYHHRAFVNTALIKGNLFRFASHHCLPNMRIEGRYLERFDWAFHHFGFFTTKRVEIGEELTWNYLGNRLEAARKAKEPFKSDLLQACACGSGKDCMIEAWTQEDYEEEAKKKKASEKKRKIKTELVEDGDIDVLMSKAIKSTQQMSLDYDSFSEGEDDLPEEQRKEKAEQSRRERNDRRERARDGDVVYVKTVKSKK